MCPFVRIDDRRFGRGFALISTLLVLSLLTLVGIAFLSLATVQVKTARSGQYQAEAEANARLALMIALGELQREMGPDQMVSTRADLASMEGDAQRFWTATYRTTTAGGKPFLKRDDLNGGLRDSRVDSEKWKEPRNFLVSGNESGLRTNPAIPFNPRSFDRSKGVAVVGGGSTNGNREQEVRVPKVPMVEDGVRTGSYGFWVGDLGVKANIAIENPYDQSKAPEKYFALLGGIGPEASGIESGEARIRLDEPGKSKLFTSQSIDLVHRDGVSWREDNFHHVTVHSRGVFANARDGGLQRNLTVFLNRETDIKPLRAGDGLVIAGLSSEDNLVGPANEETAQRMDLDWEETRHTRTSPTFGLLRDWAGIGDSVTLAGNQVEARLPKTEENFELPDVLEGSSQNLNPAALTNVDQTNLTPILVEGSMFNTFSTHLNPPGSRFPYNIRSHDFPRVVLWNPYSVPITFPSTVAMLQINGRRGFRTDAWRRTPQGVDYPIGFATWLNFGGRTRPDGPVIGSQAYEDAYTGSYYFHLEETTFQPGECLVFLPDKAAEYDGENVLNNTLSPTAEYDIANNYYHSASEFDEENPEDIGGMTWFPKKFWYQPSDAFFGGEGQLTQADDSQMILKKVGTLSSVAPPDFDTLPQIASVSCSLQFGAGREPPEAWYHDPTDPNSGVDIEFLDMVNPIVTRPPDRRTRQGYRMRWFREHDSNVQASGDNGLAKHPEAWEEAFLANWNLRAAYASRSPFENLIGNRGDGKSSGPWFFGIYTKDLYDEAVGWLDQIPVKGEDNRNLGNPFGPPSEGTGKYVLFDVPRSELGVISLAQFQHAKISEYVWHPSYAIGNSLVDPRLGLEGMTGTAPRLGGGEKDTNGFTADYIGWSSNSERGSGPETWAEHGRGLFHDVPDSANIVYDLSYEVNHSLWDDFFLSSGSDYDLRKVSEEGLSAELPNPRVKPIRGAVRGHAGDFHRSALALMNEGAFNVNSTSVQAWKAVLSANRRPDGKTPFPRVVGNGSEEWGSQEAVTANRAWDGMRVLNDEEIDRLARAIVNEVKLRGPFLSLSDFVNRRLSNDSLGEKGALEAAIEKSGINAPLDQFGLYSLNNERSLADYDHPDNIEDATLIEQTLKPRSKAWGATTYLTQADILQAIGSGLSARSDTFVIRAYGEAVSDGKIKARAWCEAVVQRLPEPIRPDDSGINPGRESEFPDFGRRFKIKNFRWLNADEV